MTDIVKFSRRDFVRLGAAASGVLVLGCRLPGRTAAPGATFEPNAYLSLDSAGVVSVFVPESEMGQGVLTALAMLVADEMDADWNHVAVKQAPTDPERFGRMSTGGSTSVRQAWQPLRRAGATAREMLITAAAQRWSADRSQCRAERSEVVHAPTGKRLGYGDLAETAAALPLPEKIRLKSPEEFQLIGKPIPRVDTPQKVDGSAAFAIDVRRPGMVYAVVARCPVFGGKAAGLDAKAALATPGVRHVVEISRGVAVVGDSTWAAIRGRKALEVRWNEGPAADLDDASIARMLERRSRESGAVARHDGDVGRALAAAPRKIEAVYRVPFLAHATMEPMSCVADVRKGSCEIWAGTQAPTTAQAKAAELLGLDPKRVTVHTTFLGGGFGRRSWPDFILETVEISKAVGAPVQLTWTREDDMRHDLYRPVSLHRLAAAFDRRGTPTAWHHRLTAPSILDQLWPGSVKNGLDRAAIEGLADLPYAIPNVLVEYVMANTAIPVMWWRSVYNSQNAFANEAFLDEMAAAAGTDPVDLRLGLLQDVPRLKRVMALAAEKAGWGGSVPAGHGLGAACHHSFGSFIAQVAEVSVPKTGLPSVHRVVCAVDCGPVVNPDTVTAQMESAIVYGLSAVLRGRISIERGRVVEGNFDDYEPLRMHEMPRIEVHIVDSAASIGGIGEPGLPPIAPAVVNALAAVTGERVRTLPLAPQV